MAKLPQILEIDPATELTFHGPFTEVVTSYLKLTNPSDQTLCFKVKTTAPKQYCVRPNSGFIPPKGIVHVAVMLQPFDINSPEERGKHKFMVQSAHVPEGETSLDSIWKQIPTSMLMDTKLKVVFESPETNSADLPEYQTTAPQRTAAQPVAAAQGISEAETRRLVDETKRLQSQLQQSELEVSHLKEKLMRLESLGAGGPNGPRGGSVSLASGPGSAISFVHVIVVAVLALIVGIVFGKVL